MAIKERRPVVCYSCGRSLGIVDITLGPEGMKKFREAAERMRAQHTCATAPLSDKPRGNG